MYKKHIKLGSICIAVLLFFFSSSVIACIAVIHSINQPNAEYTRAVMNFTCGYNYGGYCRVIIKRDGVPLSNNMLPDQGPGYIAAWHDDFVFDYGAGTYEITVNAYEGIPSRGGYRSILDTSITSSITIVQPQVPITIGTTHYFYDANGRLEMVEEQDGAITDYDYDDANNRTSKTTIK